MDKTINGTKVSKILYQNLREYLSSYNRTIKMVDISIGDDFGGEMYAKMKKKKLEQEAGILLESIHYDSINYEELSNYIKELNIDSSVNGIMLQLPLPKNLKKQERLILDLIDPNKDVDGLTSSNMGNLMVGSDTFIPCTPWGIETLLKVYDIVIEGKRVAIINRSNIVGKPMIGLILRNNGTPIICHSKTTSLEEITKESDIVIVALNKQEYIDSSYLKEGSVVIDVGVHRNNEGKTVGDVLYDDVYDKVALITPPTGGVGPMTICMLAYNAAKSVYGNDIEQVLETGIDKAKVLIKQER